MNSEIKKTIIQFIQTYPESQLKAAEFVRLYDYIYHMCVDVDKQAANVCHRDMLQIIDSNKNKIIQHPELKKTLSNLCRYVDRYWCVSTKHKTIKQYLDELR